MPSTLAAAFDRLPPERIALIERGTRWRFGDIADRARRLAAGLSALGLHRGDCLALWLGNRREWLDVLLACARLGVRVIAVNTRLGAIEVGDLLRRCEARALVLAPRAGTRCFADELAALAPAARPVLELVITVGDGDVSSMDASRSVALESLAVGVPRDAIDARPDDGVVVFTTSGTTSRPKLVLHGQRGVVHHARDVAAAFGFEAEDTVVLQALPLCGVFGFSQAMATLLAGRALVMMESFDATGAVALVRAHAVTNLVGTNEMLDRMLDATTEARPFPALRFFGHANFNPALVDLPAKAAARGVRLRGLFGMSETLALFAIQSDGASLESRALAGGVPVAGEARARIADPDTGALMATGEAGELQVTGPSLFLGYLGDGDATRRAFTPDGWLRTGDLAVGLDGGGFTLLGRMADTLRLGGYLVNPLEIEQVIADDPSIAACQVVEQARRDGTRAIAFVVLAADARFDQPALLARCRARLARFKVPARVVVLERFPTTDGPNGTKIRRAELRERAAALI